MIVVDGRTDEEKLHELLAGGAEETTLNFKATLDLAQRSSKAVLDFVKDAISMGNLPEGGYIVVGVNDDGVPAHDQATLDVAQFDSSKLRDKVGEYVEGKVRLVSQSHEVGGRTVVLVHVQPTPDGLPVPTSCIGQYDKGQGQMETIFSEGEVLIREGISNTRLRHAHWHSLLARYREQIRADARADADALIHRVVEAFKSDGGAQSVPLDLSMSDEALADAIVVAFEGPSPVRVRQFLNTAKQTAITAADDRAEWLHALDRVTIVACQAVMYQRKDVYQFVVEALEAIYQAQELPPDEPRLTSSDADTARRLLDVLLRVMAIGSLVVRQKAWIYLPHWFSVPCR